MDPMSPPGERRKVGRLTDPTILSAREPIRCREMCCAYALRTGGMYSDGRIRDVSMKSL